MNNLKNILIVTTELIMPNEPLIGGLGVYVLNLSKIFSNKGIKVDVLIPSEENENSIIHDSDISIIRFKIINSKISMFNRFLYHLNKNYSSYSFLHYLKLKSIAKQTQLKVIELNNNKKFDLVLYTNLQGVGYFRVKYICSGVWIASLTDHYSKIGRGYYGLEEDKVNAQIRIERETYDNIDFIFGPSIYMLNKLPSKKSSKSKSIPAPFINYNQNREFFKFFTNDKKRITIGFFGSIDYRKGADIFLKIANEFNWISNAVLIGKLYDDCHENKEIASLISTQKKVNYLGVHSKLDLFKFLVEVDIVILPSRVDNMPNTLLEALSLGKIVIGPDAWGFEELIEDGVNGFLFELGSYKSLICVLEKIHSLPHIEIHKIQENAFQTGINISVENMENSIYESFISEFKKFH